MLKKKIVRIVDKATHSIMDYDVVHSEFVRNFNEIMDDFLVNNEFTKPGAEEMFLWWLDREGYEPQYDKKLTVETLMRVLSYTNKDNIVMIHFNDELYDICQVCDDILKDGRGNFTNVITIKASVR